MPQGRDGSGRNAAARTPSLGTLPSSFVTYGGTCTRTCMEKDPNFRSEMSSTFFGTNTPDAVNYILCIRKRTRPRHAASSHRHAESMPLFGPFSAPCYHAILQKDDICPCSPEQEIQILPAPPRENRDSPSLGRDRWQTLFTAGTHIPR